VHDDEKADAAPPQPADGCDSAWQRLQEAIAEEMIEKLPRRMTLAQVMSFLDIGSHELVREIVSGQVLTSRVDWRLFVDPAENHAFFVASLLERLTAEQRGDASRY
jgi:hypothetical protein